MKQCRKCSSILEYSSFTKKVDTADGYNNLCRVCKNQSRNKSKDAATRLRWTANNKEHILAYDRNRYSRKRDDINKNRRQHRLDNIDVMRERDRAVYATKHIRFKSRTPSSLSPLHLGGIQYIYKEARSMNVQGGIQYHVDHIVPLNGKLVSGLHVPWNLQIIPADENLRKGNTFECT